MAALTLQQTRQLEKSLQSQRAVMQSAARDELSHAEEHSFTAIAGEVPDFGDQATAAAITDFDNEIARRNVRSIRDIEEALMRIKAHRFGICVDCGEDIGYRRMMAFPTASRCMSCQSVRERTYAGGGVPTL
jgi:DnaK suppressor protein